VTRGSGIGRIGDRREQRRRQAASLSLNGSQTRGAQRASPASTEFTIGNCCFDISLI